jgi:hypothetical protein
VRGNKKHAGKAEFGLHCRTCPLAEMCTSSKTGRRITMDNGASIDAWLQAHDIPHRTIDLTIGITN